MSLLAEEQESKSLAPASESPSSSSSSCEHRSPGNSAGRPRESRLAGSDIVTIARAPGGRTQTPAPASRTSSRAAILPGRPRDPDIQLRLAEAPVARETEKLPGEDAEL